MTLTAAILAIVLTTPAAGHLQKQVPEQKDYPNAEFMYMPVTISAVAQQTWYLFLRRYCEDDEPELREMLTKATQNLAGRAKVRNTQRAFRIPEAPSQDAVTSQTGITETLLFPAQLRIETLLSLPNETSSLELHRVSDSASLGFLGLSGSLKKDEAVYVAESLRYIDVLLKRAIVRVGVGVRIVVRAKGRRLESKLSLGSLAAEASANRLEAQMEAYLIGISGSLPSQLIDIPDELSISTLETLYRAIARIKAAIWANPKVENVESQIAIVPQIIAISVRKEDMRTFLTSLGFNVPLVKKDKNG